MNQKKMSHFSLGWLLAVFETARLSLFGDNMTRSTAQFYHHFVEKCTLIILLQTDYPQNSYSKKQGSSL